MHSIRSVFSTLTSTLLTIAQCENEEVKRMSPSEEAEIQSFLQVFPQENQNASSTIQKIKKILNVNNPIRLERLAEGAVSPPIVVSQLIDDRQVPFAVLKHESQPVWAEKRIRAISDLKEKGCEILPRIFRNENSYLFKLGENFYSCIEYLKPYAQAKIPLEQKLVLAAKLHSYGKESPWKEDLLSSNLDGYSNNESANLAAEIRNWKPSIFDTEEWKSCVKCAHYFAVSIPFCDLYNRMPKSILHGDMHSFNIIISDGKYYLIDFDELRTDIRLLEFPMFIGWSDIEANNKIPGEDKLISCIELCYGKLEESEKRNFYLFVLYKKCSGLEWALRELKKGLQSNDARQVQNVGAILEDLINFIHHVYIRMPEVKATIDSEKIDDYIPPPAALKGGELIRWQADRAIICKKHFKNYGVYPNLVNPTTFTEKVQHRMLYDRRPILQQFADKLQARDYAAKRIGEKYLTKIYQIATTPEAIDWEKMPSQYVAKTNHGSAMNTFAQWNKVAYAPGELARIKKQLNDWLETDFSTYCGEWAYREIPRRVYVEEYLGKEGAIPGVWRFYVFGGKVWCFAVDQMNDGKWLCNFYDRNLSLLDVKQGQENFSTPMIFPKNVQEMLSLAEQLAHVTDTEVMDFVRVDLYNINGRIVFSELTNYPHAGRVPFTPQAFDRILGEQWKLP